MTGLADALQVAVPVIITGHNVVHLDRQAQCAHPAQRVTPQDAGATDLELLGLRPCSPVKALDVLEDLLCEQRTDVTAVGTFEWGQAGALLPLLSTPRLAGLLSSSAEQGQYSLNALLRKLSALPRAEQLALVVELITAELTVVMQTTPDRLDHTKSFNELGVDSLMRMELIMLLRKRFQFQLSPMELIQTGGRIPALADLALHHLSNLAATEATAQA